ncbi:MAG TPA: DksA/TraR family C4-type zinc finger protein [Gammaproteobacteria bacterium]|jgi:phage/conjugal plasmid C-4 type zinc finger TraR family protein|nr:DksA/TraR family C4-type zinc finger protein [Gammaproteobacteria bacterium]
MASGWAKDGAVQDQIDSTVEDALLRVRGKLPQGESLKHCEECGAEIPQARREAMRGVRLCILCQDEQENRQTTHELYNRRGSKDSQLR